ncbi:TPA: cytochrome c maturation protein CcmE [Pseudomonas aeruginosa]|uniref:cytochrome c maturation protein CcmE n=1 Tax=Pseudomonas TaxID=286 RepID=UPI0011B48A29
MRTFKGSIKTDVQGSDVEFEVEDNATQDEVEYEAKQAAFEHVEWNFTEVKGA